MKRIVLLLLFCFILFSDLVQGQALNDYRIWYVQYGDGGTIGGVDLDGSNATVDKVYDTDFLTDGFSPSSLILGGDGMVYGTLDAGYIFQMNQDGTGYAIIHSLPGTIDGNGLLYASDGNLYGLTTSGGIYKAVPEVFAAEQIYNFQNQTDGIIPSGSLVEDAEGALYGVCRYGGVNNQAGTLFKIHKDGSAFQKLFDFSSADGYNPFALILGSDGKLYGSTLFGGMYNDGVLYGIEADGSNYVKLYEFNYSDGGKPIGPIIEEEGKIYGLAQHGPANLDGFCYSIDLDGNNITTLHDFSKDNPGETFWPVSMSIFEGKIYGLTAQGGAEGKGVIFTMDLNGANYVEILNFNGTNGNLLAHSELERGNVILPLATDNILLAISGGAASNNGLIMQLNGFYESTILKEYPIEDNYPAIIVSAGDGLIGVNARNGTYGFGGIFGLNAKGQNYEVLYTHEINETQKLVLDEDGSLYGVTLSKVVRKYDPITNNYSAVGNVAIDPFTTGQLFYNVIATDLVYVYGSTEFGVYRINKNGTGFEYIKTLDEATELSYPMALTVSDGFVYGVCRAGGNGTGGIFKMKTNGDNYEELFYFDNYYFEEANIIVASNGKLTGAITTGGSNFDGVLFSMNTDGSEYTVLAEFPIASVGRFPFKLTEVNGWLVGATTLGNNGFGSLFRIKLDGTELTKIQDNTNYIYDFTIREKLPQTITFNPVASRVFSEEEIMFSASSSESLPVEFETENTDKLEIVDGNLGAMLNPGSVTVTAKVVSPYYKPSSVAQTFCINPTKPEISLSSSGIPILTSSATAGNQWLKDGAAINGATNTSYEVTSQGTYTVQVNIDGCQSEVSDGRTIVITGLESRRELISVYPNPVKESLNVNLSGITGKVKLSIIDATGKVRSATSVEGGENQQLNVSDFNNGIYILNVQAGNKSNWVRFVKE